MLDKDLNNGKLYIDGEEQYISDDDYNKFKLLLAYFFWKMNDNWEIFKTKKEGEGIYDTVLEDIQKDRKINQSGLSGRKTLNPSEDYDDFRNFMYEKWDKYKKNDITCSLIKILDTLRDNPEEDFLLKFDSLKNKLKSNTIKKDCLFSNSYFNTARSTFLCFYESISVRPNCFYNPGKGVKLDTQQGGKIYKIKIDPYSIKHIVKPKEYNQYCKFAERSLEKLYIQWDDKDSNSSENMIDVWSPEDADATIRTIMNTLVFFTYLKQQDEMIQYCSNILKKDYNIILHGAPGTGKTYLAQQIAKEIINPEDAKEDITQSEQYGFVQFHPSYDYTDFVEGLRPITDSEKKTVGFELKDGVFTQFIKKARKDEDKNHKYVFIIDEINRGDISRIFGELFFSIDPSYRGKKGSVTTQYANLHKNTHEKFYIPENVYIIGTMNDVDRSVEAFDFAIRRRFQFIEVKADDNVDWLRDKESKNRFQDIEEAWKELNKVIAEGNDNIPALGREYEIGPAYLKPYVESDKKGIQALKELWNYQIGPLLYEYLRGNTDRENMYKDYIEIFIKKSTKYKNKLCYDENCINIIDNDNI